MHRPNRWMPFTGIPALLPDDSADPDATSGGDAGAGKGEDLGDAGKRALDAVRAEKRSAEAAKKTAEQQLASLQAELQQIRDKDLSEQQKATKRAEEAEAKAAAAESRLLRLEVAAEKGIPAAAAGRLQGSTREELSADADALKALLVPSSEATEVTTPGAKPGEVSRPKPDKTQGGGTPTDGKSVAAGAALYASHKEQKTTNPFVRSAAG